MPDEDEKNLTAIPASDSVPPGDEASTIVTEFPRHLIEALAQKAGVASRPPPALTPSSVPVRDERQERGENPDPAPPAFSPLATVEVPGMPDAPPVPSSRRPLSLPSLLQVPDARGPVVASPITEAVTPAMGSPRYDPEARSHFDPVPTAEAEAEESLELEDSHLEPYESPRPLEIPSIPAAAAQPPANALFAFAPTESALAVAPLSGAAVEGAAVGGGVGVSTVVDPFPPVVQHPALQPPAAHPAGSVPAPPSEIMAAAPRGAAGAAESGMTGVSGAGVVGPAAAHPPTTPFAFTPPPRSAVGYGGSKSGIVWAQPPPPAILMDPPTSALGWAIGGIIVGLVLLALVVWLLVVLVRHLL